MNFRVETSAFRGPIELLWFLVRRNEIDISEVALATIVEQYAQYLEILQEIQIDSVGEFLEVASRLVEMKSKELLPQTSLATETPEVYEDPRQNLVQRLLFYKQFRDAATTLEERATNWHQRYARTQDDLPPRKIDLAEQPIRVVELWDLVSAFGRVLRDNRRVQPEKVIYDDTPLSVYMRTIHQQLVDQGRVHFLDLFAPGMHKSALIGVFLAVLELTRHHNVRAEQEDLNGDIVIVPGEGFQTELVLRDVDDYAPQKTRINSGDPSSFEGGLTPPPPSSPAAS